jgi:hypothetical protein
LNSEAAGKYVVGNLTTTRSVGTGLSTLGGIGVTIAAGVDDIGNVTVLRVSGAGGIVTANSNQSIARKWTITSDNPPTSGRDLTLKWLSSDDNGKTFSASNKAIVFRYNGSIWVGVGSVKDVSGSDPRSMTVNTTSFSDWTVSDENAPLHVEALNLTALIEGFYDGSTMVSDTVTVELRNTSPGYALVEQAKVVLNTSGNNAAVNFFTAADATNYYIVVKHRNSLQTWSATSQSFSGGTLSYNFTTAQSQAFGSNMINVGGEWCIYNGDVVIDEFIDGSDVSDVFNASNAGASGYIITDLTGDDFVDGTDVSICFNNSSAGIGAAYPSKKLSPSQKIEIK